MTQIAFGKAAPFRTLEEIGRQHAGAFPGFLLLRHALALIILVHHARILLRGLTTEAATGAALPVVPGLYEVLQTPVELMRPLLYALVGAFFALSGFLVTGSALRSRAVGPFLFLRMVRIMPALTSEVLLCALLLGPALTLLPLGAYVSEPSVYAYVLNIVGIAHYELPGLFESNPIARTVNANLWTLAPEFYCYALMAGAMLTGLLYRRRSVLAVVLLWGAATLVVQPLLGDLFPTRYDRTHFTNWFIVYMFFLGVLFALFADVVRIHAGLFVLSALAYLALMLVGGADVIAGLFLAYCTVFLGAADFSRFDRLFRCDYSYGIYLYGYPIAQSLIFVLMPTGVLGHGLASTLLLIALTVVLTLGFSALSWRLVERPALKLKRLVLRPRTREERLPVEHVPTAA